MLFHDTLESIGREYAYEKRKQNIEGKIRSFPAYSTSFVFQLLSYYENVVTLWEKDHPRSDLPLPLNEDKRNGLRAILEGYATALTELDTCKKALLRLSTEHAGAINRLKKFNEQRRWIPVEHHLPEKNGTYFVLYRKRGGAALYTGVSNYHAHLKWFERDADGEKVLCWIKPSPIPKELREKYHILEEESKP